MVSERESRGIWEGVGAKALMWEPSCREQECQAMPVSTKWSQGGDWKTFRIIASKETQKNGYEMEKKPKYLVSQYYFI